MEKKKPNTIKYNFLDVGARGGFGRSVPIPLRKPEFLNLFKFYGLEPDEKECNRLLKAGYVECYPFGAYDKIGKFPFYNTVEPGKSSMRKPDEAIVKKYYYDPPQYDIASTTEISVTKIDAMFPHVDFDVMNIDTQGTELEALQGAKDKLEKCTVLFLESCTARTYHKQPLIYDILNFLQPYGFQIKWSWIHLSNYTESDLILLRPHNLSLVETINKLLK